MSTPEPTAQPDFEVGDEVQWMETKQYRVGGISFSTKYGRVAGKDGTNAVIRTRGKKLVKIALRRLVPRNKPSPVNHVFGALTDSV